MPTSAEGEGTGFNAEAVAVDGPPPEPHRFWEATVAYLEGELAKHEAIVARIPGAQAALDQKLADHHAKASAAIAARNAAQAELEAARAAEPEVTQ